MVRTTQDSRTCFATRSWKSVVSDDVSRNTDGVPRSQDTIDAKEVDEHTFTRFKTILRAPLQSEVKELDTMLASKLTLSDPFNPFQSNRYTGSASREGSTTLPSFDMTGCSSSGDKVDVLGKLGYGNGMLSFDKLAQALAADSESYANKEKPCVPSETPLTHLSSIDSSGMTDMVTPLGSGSVDAGCDFADRLGKLLERCISGDARAKDQLVKLCANEFNLTDSVLTPAVVLALLRFCILKGQLYLAGQLLQVAWEMSVQLPCEEQSQVLLTLCSDDAIGLVRNLLSKLPFPSKNTEDIMNLFVKGVVTSAKGSIQNHLSNFVSILEDDGAGAIDSDRACHLIKRIFDEIHADDSRVLECGDLLIKICRMDAFSMATQDYRFKAARVLCRLPSSERADESLKLMLNSDAMHVAFMKYVGQQSPPDYVSVVTRLIHARCLSGLSFLCALYLSQHISTSAAIVVNICMVAQRNLNSVVPESLRFPGFGDFEFLSCVGINSLVKLFGPTLPMSLLCICASVSGSGKDMFSPLIEACLLVEDHSAAESVIKYMNEYYGHVPATLLTTTLQSHLLHGNFRHVLDCLSKNDKPGSALKQRKNRGINASVAEFGMRIAISVQNFEAALEFLKHSECSDKLSPEMSGLLQKIPSMLESRNKVDEFVMMCERLTLDESTFAAVLDCCIRLKNSKKLLRMVNRFRKMGLQPQAQTCAVIIKSLGCCGRIDECRDIWNELTVQRGNEPNEVAYGIMLDALVSNNRMDEAMNLFEEMKQKGVVKPNTIMYTTLIKGFGQNRQLSKAMSIYEEMVAQEVPRNTVTYNSIIDACSRIGDMKAAAALLEDMMKNQVEPDLITFSTIIKGYCVQCNMDQSFQLLSIMYDRGIKPDGILYNSLLEGCVKSGRLWLCEKLWEQMRLHGIPPSNFTLTILIKMYGRSRQLDKVFDLVGRLPMEYGFTINAHVYTCLMSACITNNRYSTALEIYKCMKDGGIKADAKTYETLLVGATRGNLFAEAAEILKDVYNLNSSASGSVASQRETTPHHKINTRILESLFNKVQHCKLDAAVLSTYRMLSKKLQSLGINVHFAI